MLSIDIKSNPFGAFKDISQYIFTTKDTYTSIGLSGIQKLVIKEPNECLYMTTYCQIVSCEASFSKQTKVLVDKVLVMCLISYMKSISK